MQLDLFYEADLAERLEALAELTARSVALCDALRRATPTVAEAAEAFGRLAEAHSGIEIACPGTEIGEALIDGALLIQTNPSDD